MNYIFYQTKTKFINTGDALINKALLDTLREYGKLQCNCSKEIPEDFIEELGIKEEEKINCKNEIIFVSTILKRAFKSKKNKDKVFIVSGLGHTFGGSMRKVIRNLLVGFLFPIYRLFGVKIIRIGLSIGPISNLLAITEKFRSLFINEYLVRDTQSLELCHRIGIKKAKLCPDLSWLYLKEKERKGNINKNVIINLRKNILHENDENYINCMISKCEEILKEINLKTNKKMHLIFTYQVAEDKEYCKKMYEIFKNKYPSELIEDQISLKDAEKYYSLASYNISNRMHSLLLGYKYGSLPIALIDTKKHVKIEQTLIDCKLEKLAIDVYYGNKNEIEYILDNSNELLSQLFKVEKEKQIEILKILDRIFN